MLKVEKRHLKSCTHPEFDTSYTKCKCPYRAIGMLNGVFIRKALRTSNYERALKIVRDWEAEGEAQERSAPVTVDQAAGDFLADIAARQLNDSTARKYRTLVKQLRAWAQQVGFEYVKQLDVEAMTQFRTTWKMGARASAKKLEQLRRFFRFAVDRKWIEENPAAKVQMPTIRPAQKNPFTPDELRRVYEAALRYPGDETKVRKLYAFILLLRYTGLRISDVATFSADKLDGSRAFLYMHKSAEPVYTWLPDFVVERVRALPLVRGKYFFLGPKSERLDTHTDMWRRKLNAVFKMAGEFKHHPHPHRFRHTFAVDLLQKGVSIEDVATLLGHSSVKITERHYAKWVKGRQERLEGVLQEAWAGEGRALRVIEGKKGRVA